MEKCLVTKLIAEVNNPSLPIFEPFVEVSGIKVGSVGQYISLDSMIGSMKCFDAIFEFDITLNDNIESTSKRSVIFGMRNGNLLIGLEEINCIPSIKSNGSTVQNLLSVGTRTSIQLIVQSNTAIVNSTTYDLQHRCASNSTFDNIGLFTKYIGTTPEGNQYPGIYTLHSFKVYDVSVSEDAPVMNLIPCKNSDGKGLFYDMVSHTKLYANTGDLIAVE